MALSFLFTSTFNVRRWKFDVRLAFCVAVMTLIATAVPLRAGDLFQLGVTTGSTTITTGGNNLLNLIDPLTGNSQQFAPLSNQNFTSTVSYAGIPRAIQFQQSFDSSGNRVISVQVPSVGVNQTFSSADGDLSSQIKHYLKREGFAQVAEFQAVVDRSSPAGVVDGNPLAATALLEDAGYNEFALHASPFEIDGEKSATTGFHIVNRCWADGGVQDDGGSTGQYVNLTLATEIYFNDIIGLSFTTPLRYWTLKSADVFMGGEVIGLPINVLPARGGPLSWMITPEIQGGAAASQDLVSGGLLFGAQINSSLSYNISGFTFTLADNAGYDHGVNFNIAGYRFETHTDQFLFKNGLQVSKSFGNFFIDASGTYTDFARRAFVRGYFTPEFGLGFRFGPGNDCGLRIGYVGNFGDNFNSNGGDVMLYFKS